jgi:hypothetical protein
LLYNDGYISGMFGALEAAQYFTRLLHFDERLLQLVFQHELGAIGPAVQNAHPSNFIANQVAWILDYKLRNYGTVVPQRIWTPASAADAQRYGYAQLNIPIFFVRRDQKTVGLRLVEAAAGSCEGLLNTRAPSPVGDCHTTSIRLNVSTFPSRSSCSCCANNVHFQWPGYREQNSQIMTKDQTQAHNTIPLGALAARIARAVGSFLEVRQPIILFGIVRQTKLEVGFCRAALPVPGLAGWQGCHHGK